jgi:hypothetical protein
MLRGKFLRMAGRDLWRLNRATQDRYSTARVSKRPTDEPAAQQSHAVLYRCPNVTWPDLDLSRRRAGRLDNFQCQKAGNMSKFVQVAIHLIVLTISLLSFDVFYLGHGPNASHTERLIMAFVFCALLYGVVASFIEDLLRPGLTRLQIVQTGVSLTVFGFIILLNIWIGHKIANHLSLSSWETSYVAWLGIVFFLLAIALRVAIPFSLLFPKRPEPKETKV